MCSVCTRNVRSACRELAQESQPFSAQSITAKSQRKSVASQLDKRLESQHLVPRAVCRENNSHLTCDCHFAGLFLHCASRACAWASPGCLLNSKLRSCNSVPRCIHQPLVAARGCTPHLTWVVWLLKRVLANPRASLACSCIMACCMAQHTGPCRQVGSRRSAGAALN
jgi:hypothetical protein